MERKITITTADNGIKVTKTFNHFNPNLADSDCVLFAQNLNMLTDNSLKKVVRTDKTDITSAI